MQNHVKVEQTIAQSEKLRCKTSAKLWDRLTQLHNWTKCNKCFIWVTWLQYFVKQTAGSLSDLLKPGHVAPKLESYLALHRGISPVATSRSGCWSNCAKPNRQSNPRGNFEPEEELFFCCVREWPELLLTIQVVAVLPFLVRAISFACRPASNHLLSTVLSQTENRYDPPLLLCAITLINTPVGGCSFSICILQEL